MKTGRDETKTGRDETKTLSCKRAGELLPLYAAGDLEAARAAQVAAHIDACAGCRALAAEFGESRAALAEACETPEFGDEFYAGIRGAVLSEIARDRVRPSKPSLLAALFPARRLAYAATFALLLIAFAVALQLSRRDAQTQTASAPQTPNKQPRPAAITSQPKPTATAPQPMRKPLIKHDRATVAPRTFVAQARREARPTLPTPREMRDEVAHAQRAPSNPTRDAAATGMAERVNGANGANGANAPRAPEVSRIEIQTADPNIRIIWLAPARAEERARDRDNHENGDRE